MKGGEYKGRQASRYSLVTAAWSAANRQLPCLGWCLFDCTFPAAAIVSLLGAATVTQHAQY
jgi:hypothetical protein